jgi:hypothetical protein
MSADEEVKRTFATIDGKHPITKLANALANECVPIAARIKISKMDYCTAMANAIGLVLADAGHPGPGGKPLPREEAVRRFDDLRKVMEGAYDLRDVRGEG